MGTFKTNDEFLAECASNTKVRIIGKYVGCKTKIKCECLLCGSVGGIVPGRIQNGLGCSMCAKRQQSDINYQKEALKNKKVKVLGEYKKFNIKIECECVDCGNTWFTRPVAILRGHACPKCAKSNAGSHALKSTPQYKKELKSVESTLKLAKGEVYLTTSTKITHQCKLCGIDVQMSPDSALRGHGCPSCAAAVRGVGLRKSNEVYQEEVRKTNTKLKVLGKYVSNTELLLCKCVECGYEDMYSPGYVRTGHGCRACSAENKGSKRWKFVELGRRTVKVHGYEHFALEHLKKEKVKLDDIKVRVGEGKPRIKYIFKGKEKTYTPDFYRKSINTIIEVKSIWTLAGSKTNEWLARNAAKAEACISQGYTFDLMLMSSKGKRLALEQNWYLLSRAKLNSQLRALKE